MKIYFIKYTYLGRVAHIQVEARTEAQAREIFQREFPPCSIMKVETIESLADEVSDKVMEVVKQQFAEKQPKEAISATISPNGAQDKG